MINKKILVIIPAFSDDQRLPDQHTRKLDGITLIQRAINLALGITSSDNILLITDIEEIALIAKRNSIQSKNINITDFNSKFLSENGSSDNYIIILRSNNPLVNKEIISDAIDTMNSKNFDILVSARKNKPHNWKDNIGNIDGLINSSISAENDIELKSFVIIRAASLGKKIRESKLSSYLLGDSNIEIKSHQDWWICEKLLQRKRILFVVAGSPSIGMGHIYRSLTLAHEIHDHEIIFMSTRDSGLALKRISEKYYPTHEQINSLTKEVLALKPHMVINDFLDTSKEYITSLINAGIKVVNFEDFSDGATHTDLTINELIDDPIYESENTVWGSSYLFLRDEFNDAKVHVFSEEVKTVLITFGGTDPKNYTLRILKKIYKYCRERKIEIKIVTGSGYRYKNELKEYINKINYSGIKFTWATNIMSHVMEDAQLAISSNGRTIYELAHMNIPAIIVAQNKREEMHKFSNFHNGFINLGILNSEDEIQLVESNLRKLVEDIEYRRSQMNKMVKYNFLKNKSKVVNMIMGILTSSEIEE